MRSRLVPVLINSSKFCALRKSLLKTLVYLFRNIGTKPISIFYKQLVFTKIIYYWKQATYSRVANPHLHHLILSSWNLKVYRIRQQHMLVSTLTQTIWWLVITLSLWTRTRWSDMITCRKHLKYNSSNQYIWKDVNILQTLYQLIICLKTLTARWPAINSKEFKSLGFGVCLPVYHICMDPYSLLMAQMQVRHYVLETRGLM